MPTPRDKRLAKRGGSRDAVAAPVSATCKAGGEHQWFMSLWLPIGGCEKCGLLYAGPERPQLLIQGIGPNVRALLKVAPTNAPVAKLPERKRKSLGKRSA